MLTRLSQKFDNIHYDSLGRVICGHASENDVLQTLPLNEGDHSNNIAVTHDSQINSDCDPPFNYTPTNNRDDNISVDGHEISEKKPFSD